MVMGLLSMIIGVLMYTVSQSVQAWRIGEDRAELESRTHHAIETVTRDLGRLAGLETQVWSTGREDRFARARGDATQVSGHGRLVADYEAFAADGNPVPVEETGGGPSEGAPVVDWYPRLRFVVRIDPVESEERVRAQLRAALLVDEPQLDASERERRVRAAMLGITPPRTAEICLRVRPTGAGNGAYLALYRDVRPLVAAEKGRWVDGAALPELTGEPVAEKLLYVGIRFRSQFTRSFAAPPLSDTGPELCWDSARAGLFDPDHPVLRFGLDLDAQSAQDPLDDVMPSAYELTVVTELGADRELVALLEDAVDTEGREIRVNRPELLLRMDTEYVKIGSEWIRFSGVRDRQLLDVRRGQRGTAARPHAAGARVLIGRQTVLTVPVPVAREYWNG